MSEGNADILVVIPCLNEQEHIQSLLTAIARDVPGALIVVADGGSTDNSRAIVEIAATADPCIRLLDNPRRIQSAGVNLAARRFGGGRTWLARVDAHCGYPSGYVSGLVAAAIEQRADSVTVPMRTVGFHCFQRATAAAQNSVLGTGGSPHRHVGEGRFVDHGHHALMRLEPFLAVGGYCESFTHNEDAELDHRLGRHGARIWLEPSLAIDYYPRRSARALFRQYLNYGRGRAKTITRHRIRLKPRQAAPLGVAPAVGLAILAPFAGWWLALPALAWAAMCLAYGLKLAGAAPARERRCVALSGFAAMTMHLGWSLGFWRQVVAGPKPGPAPSPLRAER